VPYFGKEGKKAKKEEAEVEEGVLFSSACLFNKDSIK
jgi:hypothetical protein